MLAGTVTFAVVRFTLALQMETDIHDLLDKKDFDSARDVYERAKVLYDDLRRDEAALQ